MLTAFPGSSLGKSSVEIMLGAVLNYNSLFLFMMTSPSVMQLFSVRQERSGSLLIVCQTEGRESSCLLFSMLPLHQFHFQSNALVTVGLKQGTEEHRAVPAFSSKSWLQNTGNNCHKFFNSVCNYCKFQTFEIQLAAKQNYLITTSEIISTEITRP